MLHQFRKGGLRRQVSVLGLVVIAVSGLLIATAPAASATTYGPYYIKETYASWRIGAPNLNLYDPVVETMGGRELYIGTTATAYHYKIHFMADTTKCVAAADNQETVDIKPCSGANGVVWIAEGGPDGCSAVLESQEFSGKYLSGRDSGTQFRIQRYQAGGAYQQFRLVDPQTGHVMCF